MGFWFWFSIFAGISVLALVAYGLLGLSIAKKAANLNAPAERLETLVKKLEKTSEAVPVIEKVVSALDQDEQAVTQRRNAVVKSRSQRKEAKQRRLIERLRDVKIDESRLNKDA